MALTQANPQRQAVSLGGHESFCSPLPAPMSHSPRPGRAHSPLTATCLQAPSSSPMSSPWPSRASRCSTSSSPLASACAGAASGCGQPFRPTWAAWVGAPHDPHLQLLGSGGLRLHVPCMFAGCSLVMPVHAWWFRTWRSPVGKVQGSRAHRSLREESGVMVEAGVHPRGGQQRLTHVAQSVHAGP